MKKYLEKVISGTSLEEKEMIEIMTDIMEGKVSDIELSAFLVALKIKGESIEEITGGAKVMRDKATFIKPKTDYTVDTCGTGGDGLHTFNISTTVAFILAAAEVTVVKHGNRSVSSKSGSADVLEALGVNLNLSPENIEKCVNEKNIGFLFAPTFHGAMKYAMNVRKTLGIRTIFNLLGPLTNPARAKGQILGVFSEELTEVFAKVLNNLGTERALVIHGLDGLDEISISTKTKISELKNGEIRNYYIEPKDFGMVNYSLDQIKGGDSKENAKILKGILKSEIKGAKREIVLLNAGASLYVGKKVESIKEGIDLAKELLDSGKAYKKLMEFIEYTKEV